MLRQDFAETSARDAAAARRAEGRPEDDGVPEIHGVVLTDGSGAPLDRLVPGGALVAAVDVTLPAGIETPVVGIGIDSPTGQVVYGTHTGLLGAAALGPGRRTVRVRLDGLALGEGQYSVHAAVADARRELVRASAAASFAVHGDGRSIGVLRADATVLDA